MRRRSMISTALPGTMKILPLVVCLAVVLFAAAPARAAVTVAWQPCFGETPEADQQPYVPGTAALAQARIAGADIEPFLPLALDGPTDAAVLPCGPCFDGSTAVCLSFCSGFEATGPPA